MANETTKKEEKLTGFELAIKKYLDGRALSDPLFATTYAKKNKSLKECCAYIRQEAKKQAVHGCAAIADDTVYGWAVHYYDEDSIKVESAPSAKVVAPTSTKAPKAAPAAPKGPEKPKEYTKAQLKRGEDWIPMGLIFD